MPLHETAFLYVECDVPAGVTLEGWRAAKAPTPRRRPIDLLLGRASRRPRTSVDPVHDSASTRE